MVSRLHHIGSHAHAVSILAQLTRNRENSKWLVMTIRAVVPTFVFATESFNDYSRRFACYALQNLSQDKFCRQEVANTPNLLVALCKRARKATDETEKLAAISALKNLTDEPANLVPMTNAQQCFATLIQISQGHGKHNTEMMQYLACDGLSTLSYWFRKVATSAQVMDVDAQGPPLSRSLFVPSLKVVTWNQWE